jgi:hypothetical protein
LIITGGRATTPDDDDLSIHDETTDQPDHGEGPEPAEPALSGQGGGRSKARAQVPKPFPVDILIRATGPLRQNSDIEHFVNDVASHYDVSDHVQAPGVITDVLRIGMKRSAVNLSRSEFEIYTFGTKHDLPESAVDELLAIVSNVSDAHVVT